MDLDDGGFHKADAALKTRFRGSVSGRSLSDRVRAQLLLNYAAQNKSDETDKTALQLVRDSLGLSRSQVNEITERLSCRSETSCAFRQRGSQILCGAWV